MNIYQSKIKFHIFLCFSHSLASEISISSGYMKLFTESWLDLTLSDPLRHSATACNIVWQVAHDHHTDLVKYQTRIARFPCFKTPEHFKDISYLPKTPRFTLASKTTAIFIIERKKKSSKVSSKVSQ